MAVKLSKADYLKRYLEPEKKKRKKKPNSNLIKKKNNINIIDEDVSFKDLDKRKDSSDDEQDKPLVYAEDGLSLIQQNELEKEKAAASKWKTVKDKDEDSVSNRNRHDSDSDYSPVRQNKANSDSDFSPVRKHRQRKDSDSDYSPQRKNNSDSDYSPPGRRRRHDSDNSDYDDIPRDQSKHEHIKREKSSSPEVMKKKSGLQTADSLRKENRLRKKQEYDKFRKMEASVSGKGVGTVYRDKEGKRRNIANEKVLKKEEEQQKLEDDKVFKEWGKGVAQTKERKQQIEGNLHEMSKPLARYQDDKDLDNLLKNQLRSEDPMLAYISKKASTNSKKKEKPRYKGPPPPPNRFNIFPGYRWDGVDRSNGFEKKRFTMLAGKKSLAEDAYKWSVEDM